MSEVYHIPVLLKESVDGLNICPDGVYVDVTLGGGGHSREILRRIGEGEGHLFGFDQDKDVEERLGDLKNDSHFTFVRSNFRYLSNFLRYYGVEKIDGLIADLGVSSHHFDEKDRGFSFRFESRLDMRMNQRSGMSAADVVNHYDERRLADVLYQYGELRNSRQLAAKIVKMRPLTTTTELGEIAKGQQAQLFQAIRIEVNHELDALREMLQAAGEVIREGGRLVVITYHSLEDRMVKQVMREQGWKRINKKVIVADEQEIIDNPRSRSAKLRIAEKV